MHRYGRQRLEDIETTSKSVSVSFAQNSSDEQEIIQLSKEKWQWMADKDAALLEDLFHESAGPGNTNIIKIE